MNRDELPERERFTIRYDDYEYTTIIEGQLCYREHIKNAIMAHVMYALRQFHGQRRNLAEDNAKLMQLLFELAGDYNQVAGDLRFRNFMMNREVD